MHDDFCSVKDTASDCDSGAQSGLTDSASCGNENCRTESMKSINSINTRHPDPLFILYFLPNFKSDSIILAEVPKRAGARPLVRQSSTRKLSTSKTRKVIDGDTDSPNRKVRD